MFSDQALGCSKKRDTKYTNGIVTQQFIESVGWLGERSHSECDSTKTCDTSGSSQETPLALSPLVKRSLAMAQPDPLRSPPQAPPQPQYPAAQMAQPSMTNSAMSQVGQPMHGAAPAVNAHGGPALAGQVGTPGTGLDAPRDTRAAAMPGARRSTARRPIGAVTSRQTSLAVSKSDRLRSLYNPPAPISTPIYSHFSTCSTHIRRRTLTFCDSPVWTSSDSPILADSRGRYDAPLNWGFHQRLWHD